MYTINLSYYESPEGTRILKKPQVNRYIELCNPFSRISNSFPRNGQLVLSDCNSFPRIRQSNSREFIVSFEGTNSNPREPVVHFEGTNCTNRYNDLLMAVFF